MNQMSTETRAERKTRGAWWRSCTTQPPRTGPLDPVATPALGCNTWVSTPTTARWEWPVAAPKRP
eukprot:1171631-Lingulodinium_polyedra.AAC.1